MTAPARLCLHARPQLRMHALHEDEVAASPSPRANAPDPHYNDYMDGNDRPGVHDQQADGSSVARPARAAPPSPPKLRTRLQKGIKQPKIYKDRTVRYGMFSSTGEPRTLSEALDDKNWRSAMQEEYDALMTNKTWHLVPPSKIHKIL